MRLLKLILIGISCSIFALSKGNIIIHSEKMLTFSVEIARSKDEKERGLMYRKQMPKDEGMLFVYNPPQPVSMWMKNTYIPLDIIFISPSGKIVQITEDTTPLSHKILSCLKDTYSVLELNAGIVNKYKIKIGQHTEFIEQDNS